MTDIGWLLDRFWDACKEHAIIWRDMPYVYGWLLAEELNWLSRFRDLGIQAGTVVALEGDYSPLSISALLALIDQGCIVVPLTLTVEAHRPRFMEIAEVQKSLVFSGDYWNCLCRPGVAVTHPLTRKLIETGDAGLVIFSSGSTGEPKAALHSFTPLLEKFKVKRHCLRSITFLLMDHLGGINTLFYVLSNMGTVVPVGERSPDAVCATIEKHRVELLPTSPTFLNLLLLSEAYQRYDLSSLRQISYGTEPMPESTLKRLHEVFPNVTLLQTYGLSELGVLRSKSKASDSLWLKVGGDGFETKVVDGTLWIRAQSAMLGYLNAPSPFDGDGWYNTGDEVEVDGEYIRFLGRRSEAISVGGQKVYPAEVESVLMEMPGILDASVRGEANPIMGQVVVARVTLAEPDLPYTTLDLPRLRRHIRQYCAGKLAAYKVPVKVEIATDVQYSERFKKMRRQQAEA